VRAALIEARLTVDGVVKDVRIKRPSGDRAFDQRAVSFVKNQKYKVPIVKGKPVEAFLTVSVSPHEAMP
jgi:TonB family protein